MTPGGRSSPRRSRDLRSSTSRRTRDLLVGEVLDALDGLVRFSSSLTLIFFQLVPRQVVEVRPLDVVASW